MAVNVEHSTNKHQKQYNHLTTFERGQIKALIDEGWTIRAIARYLGRAASSISRELKRGNVTQLTSDYRTYTAYFPDTAQTRYNQKRQKCRKPFLLNEVQPFLAFASQKILHDKWSPDAVVAYCKNAPEWQQEKIPCTKTLYNYIALGLLEARNIDLPLKVIRKAIKKHSHEHKRIYGKSIDQRPDSINDRLEAGHWEIDTVLGKQKDNKVLLTLTERKTRAERLYLIEGKKADSVNQVMEQLKKELGDDFSKHFKSITADNGSEFARLGEVLEGSGCEVYYAHPYSAWERGSNERHNGLIRRMLPKGKSMDGLNAEKVAEIENWCNTYPRKILDYKTPEECLKAELEKAENEIAC